MKKTTLRQAAMKLALVACMLLAPLGLRAQETLTVYDGTITNAYVPIYGGYFDDFTKSEFVIPANALEDMAGGTISAIKFYISSVATYGTGWDNTHQVVFLKEVGETTLSAYSGMDDATIVFDGMFTVPASTDTEFEITFTTPYQYEGGNLLIGIYNTDDGSYKTVNWYGQNVTGASGGSSNGTALNSVTFTQRNFIPKTTFTYEPAQQGGDVCDKPSTCEVSDLTATSATLTWGGGSGRYNVELKAGSADWATVLSGTTLTSTSLTLQPTTTYQARVQSVCDGTTPTSGWKTSTSFNTPCASYDIPYTYDFEDAAPFACWTPITGVTHGNSSSNAHNSSYYLRFASTTSNLVALPQFNEATNHLRVEFWTRPESNTNSSCGTFSVGYMTDITDASTFVEVENYAYNDWASATYVKKNVDFINAPANANIAFRHNAGSSSWYWFVDDVTVKEIPSCVAPTALAANPSTTSAELSWTANSGETAWTLYYKKAADANYTEVTNATNPYTLQGLQAATSYLYYVVANCAAEDASEPSEPFAFATECDVIPAVGYSENFDSYTAGNNVLPACWSYINTTTYSSYQVYPRVYPNSQYTTYAHTAPNCIYFYSYYSSSYSAYDPQPQYAILPEMSNLAGKFVTLWAKGYNTTSTFKIGTMTDPADAGTFVAITEQASLTTSYQEFEYVIPANAEGHYLAIMIDAASSSRTTNGVYIDDIQITEVPTCRKPSALACDSKTAHTATLSWTENGSATAWQVSYSTNANFDPADGTIVDVDANPGTIEGLAQSTTYYAYVRANCGNSDYSAWNSTKVTFTTPAGNRTPTGLTVNNTTITSSQATASWNAVAGNTLHQSYDIYWALASVTEVPAEPAAPNLIAGITETSQVISDLEAETTYKVWVRDNCGTDGYSNWSSTPSTFMTAAACQMPDGLAASNVTTNSATISWNTYGLTEFNLRYSTDGENWTTENNVSSPYTFNGTLSSNTAYQVQVQATCNTEVWTSSLEFTTLCDPITISAGHPWTEDFEAPVTTAVYNTSTAADLVVPDCWDNYTSNNGYVYYIPHIIKSDAGSSGYNYSDPASQVLYFYGQGNSYAALPLFSNALNELQISFKWATEGSSQGTLTLGYITAEDNGTYNTFTQIGASYNANSQSQHQMKSETVYLNNVPNTATRLVFRWYYNGWYGANIDDIEVSMAPSCYPVGTLTKANEGPHSVELSWTLVDNTQDAWVVEYADNSEFNNVQTASATTNTNFALNNLTPETHYWVRVKADCGNSDYGEVSNVVDFTTGIACHAPSALTASNETTSSMELNWTNGDVGQDAWVIAYKKEGDANFTEVAATSNPYELTGLTDGKTYTLKVRANCGNVDGLSQWSGEITHATVASCSTPTNVAYSDVNAHGATITWDGEAANHDIEYRTVTTAEANETYDFDDNSMQGWTVYDEDGDGNSWSVISGNAHSGSYSLQARYNGSAVPNNWLISPEIPLGGTLRFYAKRYDGGSGENFQVYVSTTGTEIANFTAISEVTPASTTYTLYEFDLSSYSGNGYVAIKHTAASNMWYLYVDDINITYTAVTGYGAWQTVDDATSPHVFDDLNAETIYEVRVIGDCGATTSPYSDVVSFTTQIACYPVTNLTITGTTAHSVTFSWDDTHDAGAYIVKEGDNVLTGETAHSVVIDATHLTATISGLDENETYNEGTFKVFANCGANGNSAGVNVPAFTTPCSAVTDFPWSENFNSLTEANSIPDCWDNEEGTTSTASNKWCYTTATSGNGACNGTSHDDSKCVRFNSYTGSHVNYLKSIPLSLPAGQPMQLKFWYKNPAGGDFSVYISTDGGATHTTALATGLTGVSSWTEHAPISLSAYAGEDVVIVFKGTSNNGYGDAYIYLDDVTVEPYTVEKSIEANKWYAISSPVHNSGDNETLAGVTNLTSGTYDLFGYTESAGTWDKPTTTLDMGKGYIYRAAADVTLRFAGIPNSGSISYDLSYAGTDNNIKGFNLVGNPYPQTATPGMVCYSLTPSGTWHAQPANYTAAICEAVLVKTNGTGNEVSFTPSGAKGVTRTPALTFTVSNEKYEDVAYARFDNGDELPKIGHLEPNAPALSIPVGDKTYAIANLDSDCESFVMNFSGMGDYTISASGEVSYLHLIDKVTGSDIDLLSQPSYSFKANMGDISSRFLVKLAPNGKDITDGDFAFRNGNGWIVEGEGILEAYDAMGRLLFAQEISSSSYQLSTSHFPAAGVYILRLGGNSQKIVVTK